MKNKIDIEHLTLVEGLNYEGVLRILDEHQIPHKIVVEPRKGMGYFRDSALFVEEDRMTEAVSLLGQGAKHASSHFKDISYYGAYQMGSEFDTSSLDGNIKFSKGRLIERVTLRELKEKKLSHSRQKTVSS